jgi:alkyl hydroperoxide reductase subunit AhpC
MTLVGKACPEFVAEAYEQGKFVEISSSSFRSKTLVLVFYPLDFTFVCPTEILAFSGRRKEFEKEGAAVVLASCDSKYAHRAWSRVRKEEGGVEENVLPMIADKGGRVAQQFGLYIGEEGYSQRATVIAHKGRVVYECVHAGAIGRSVHETLRVVQALNFHEKYGEVCPVEWAKGSGGVTPK